MTRKQRISIAAMTLFAAAMIVLLVWMIVRDDYRLWVAEPALLCFFAVALRAYAFEWRRLRDGDGWRER